MRCAIPMLLGVLAGAGPVLAQAPSCPAGPHAWVLSGGGARGFAHIGVLDVLDSLGRRPDLIAGTSSGAMIGALYASGYSAAAVDSVLRAVRIWDVFRDDAPFQPLAFGPYRPLVAWEQGRGIGTRSVTAFDAEVSLRASETLLEGNLLARGDFARLPVPFVAVAAALDDGSAVALDHGDLARAVRASMAVPLVLPPEAIDGRLLADGGLVDNVPVAAARARGAVSLTVVDVSRDRLDSLRVDSPGSLASWLVRLLLSETDSLGPADRRVTPDVDTIGLLAFTRGALAGAAAEGRRAARAVLADGGCAGGARPAPARPAWHIRSVTFTGARAGEARAFRRQLGLQPGAALDVARTRAGLARLRQAPGRRVVWLAPTGAPDSLDFHVTVVQPPTTAAGLGAVYDHDLGGRLWLGVSRRGLPGLLLGSVAVSAGEFQQQVRAGIQSDPVGPAPLGAMVRVAFTHDDLPRYDSLGQRAPSLGAREGTLVAGVQRVRGGRWITEAGFFGIVWRDSSTGNGDAAGALLRLQRGADGMTPYIRATAIWTGVFRSGALEWEGAAVSGGWRFAPAVRLAAGEHLPDQRTFPLGGQWAFPGLKYGEARGDREAYARVAVSRPVLGPMALRVDVAGGASARGGPLVPDARRWLGGARVGITANSPLGPLHFGLGWATGHHRAFFVRVGGWF